MIDPIEELRNNRPDNLDSVLASAVVSGVYARLDVIRRRKIVVSFAFVLLLVFAIGTFTRRDNSNEHAKLSHTTASTFDSTTSTPVNSASPYLGISDSQQILAWTTLHSKGSQCMSLKDATADLIQFLEARKLITWKVGAAFHPNLKCATFTLNQSNKSVTVMGI